MTIGSPPGRQDQCDSFYSQSQNFCHWAWKGVIIVCLARSKPFNSKLHHLTKQCRGWAFQWLKYITHLRVKSNCSLHTYLHKYIYPETNLDTQMVDVRSLIYIALIKKNSVQLKETILCAYYDRTFLTGHFWQPNGCQIHGCAWHLLTVLMYKPTRTATPISQGVSVLSRLSER